MILPIIIYGSTLLRKHSVEVTETDDIKQIVNNLFDTLKKDGGLGLAAPQIGNLKRVFLMDTTPLFENDNSIEKVEQAFINPEIIGHSPETIFYEEGCMSIPGIYESVERSLKIRVRYQDTFFKTIEKELDGMQARIFQHEYDHLEGILFIDKLSPLRRTLLSGKLNKIKKNESNYSSGR